jgi:hypothetical protein
MRRTRFLKNRKNQFLVIAEQVCLASLPGKSAGQVCRASLPGKSAGQDCRARLPGKSEYVFVYASSI